MSECKTTILFTLLQLVPQIKRQVIVITGELLPQLCGAGSVPAFLLIPKRLPGENSRRKFRLIGDQVGFCGSVIGGVFASNLFSVNDLEDKRFFPGTAYADRE